MSTPPASPLAGTVSAALRHRLWHGLAAIAYLMLAGCAGTSTGRPPARVATPAPETVSVYHYAQGLIEVDLRGGDCRVRLSGTLNENTVQRLNPALAEVESASCRSKRLVLDMNGGTIGNAITVGAMLKNRNYDTQVQHGTTCLTPCLLVFAAGRQRVLPESSPPARIGFQQIPPDQDFGHRVCESELSYYQSLSLTRYLRAMLPAPTATAVFQKLKAADCQRTDYFGLPEALAIGLATGAR